MKPIAIDPIRDQPLIPRRSERRSAAATPIPAGPVSRFWLRVFFRLARHAPWVLRAVRPLGVWAAVRFSAKARQATHANARRIFGMEIPESRRAEFARRVMGSFYDFVIDIARSSGMTARQLRERIERIDGRDAYVAHRQSGGGAIIVTAHMGSFEAGLAALADVERHIHVVFKRDALDGFETIRRSLRDTLGVSEAAIDDGWETWMRLRDALANNQVVVMQGDRAMPGQKAQAVPLLGGHVLLPLGPIKLAQISGSPIVPVFTVRTPSGRCRLFAEPPISVDPGAELVNGVHPALLALGKVIERFVAAYPEQWLMLDAAFMEDMG